MLVCLVLGVFVVLFCYDKTPRPKQTLKEGIYWGLWSTRGLFIAKGHHHSRERERGSKQVGMVL